MAQTQPLSLLAQLRNGRNAARQLRILARAEALSPREFHRLTGLIIETFDAWMAAADVKAPTSPPPIEGRFTVIVGGLSDAHSTNPNLPGETE